ncbi:LysR family transcriptional regulator [Streptomyces avermitilis]
MDGEGGGVALNLPQLRAFVAVVDAGGFGTAAADLGLSQSAVSHAVASLERTLAAPLIVRSTPVRTTALGEVILPHARSALAATDAICDAATRHDAATGGTVRLAATPTVCQGLLPSLLRHWSEHLPAIRIRVFEGSGEETETWLASAAADAAVVVDPPAGSGALLVTDPFFALLPQDHPLAGEETVHVADLADDPLILSPNGCERHVRTIHRLAGQEYTPGSSCTESRDAHQHGPGRSRRLDPAGGVTAVDPAGPRPGARHAAPQQETRPVRTAEASVAPGSACSRGLRGPASDGRDQPRVTTSWHRPDRNSPPVAAG